MTNRVTDETIHEVFQKCDIELSRKNSNTGKLFFRAETLPIIKFIRDFYGFDILKKIEVIILEDGNFELTYYLYEREDEEDVLISFIIKDSAKSICELYKNAQELENEITKNYNIKFL